MFVAERQTGVPLLHFPGCYCENGRQRSMRNTSKLNLTILIVQLDPDVYLG